MTGVKLKIGLALGAILMFFLLAGGLFVVSKKAGDESNSPIKDSHLSAVENFPAPEKKLPQIILGVVSDIHAGSESIRKTDTGNNTYPRRYKEYFPAVLDEMKGLGANLILTVGDNTHKGVARFAEDIKNIAKEKELEVIWTKGNHDKSSTDVMSVFGVQKDYYYTVDKCDWKFIVLNSCEKNANSMGGIGEEQMEWLKTALETDKKIVISMHHSIWDKDTKEFIYPDFLEFEKIISSSEHVRHVFSGHTHIDDYSKIHNGIEYHAIPALSLGQNEKYSYGKKVFSLE